MNTVDQGLDSPSTHPVYQPQRLETTNKNEHTRTRRPEERVPKHSSCLQGIFVILIKDLFETLRSL